MSKSRNSYNTTNPPLWSGVVTNQSPSQQQYIRRSDRPSSLTNDSSVVSAPRQDQGSFSTPISSQVQKPTTTTWSAVASVNGKAVPGSTKNIRPIVTNHPEVPAKKTTEKNININIKPEKRDPMWASVQVKNTNGLGYPYKQARNTMDQVRVWLPSVVVQDEKVIQDSRKAALNIPSTYTLVRCFPDFRFAWARELKPFIGSEDYPGKVGTIGIQSAVDSAVNYVKGKLEIPADNSW